MKVLLCPNLDKKDSAACMGEIIRRLGELDIEPMAAETLAPYIDSELRYTTGPADSLVEQCDVLMPVGGDGTLIECAHTAVRADKPVLGVNTGRVGFLTQLEAGELDKLRLLRDGRYAVSARMMLEGTVDGEAGDQTFAALNDIVISRVSCNGIADVEVHQGERLITRQRGDGMIFSTPTGSTGYSLSAGGPIVDPELELILLTSICPHATFRCSMALPADKAYTAREHIVNRESGLVITADGRHIGQITARNQVHIRKFHRSVRFLELGIHDFYGNLGEKLSWNR